MEPTRLFDFIYYQQENCPQEKAFGYKYEGEWKYFSTQEVISIANNLSRGLLKLGINKGDRIAVSTYKNRPEWVFLDIALQQIGAINVPVYPTISPFEYEYIFNDAGVSYCFVGEGDLYDKVKKAQESVSSLKEIFTFDKQENRKFWKDLLLEGDDKEIEYHRSGVDPNDLATVIYTSGTTGNPKGVMLCHNNISSNVLAAISLIPTVVGEKALSFLPLCHIFERTVSYAYIFEGINIIFTGTDNLGGEEGDLATVKPHFFTTVPRLLEKVYEKIYNKGLSLTGLKRKLFFWAVSLTDDYDFDEEFSGMAGIQRKLADKLIFSKWRAALGGNVKGILTGAAPCPMKMIKIFSAAGIPIREGYGLTESSPAIAVGSWKKEGAMFGAVGPVIDGVEVVIDESDGEYRAGEGEILAKGPNIMMGYYNKPLETAKVIKEKDGERWLCTGDVGKLIEGPGGKQFLAITDRKKELLKTSGGKYVAPAPIENKFKEDFMIEQMMVVGEKKKFVSALIVPAVEALKDWCGNNSIEWTSLSDIINHPKVVKRYEDIVNLYNPLFSHIEQIKKFVLVDKPWEATKPDGSEAELTPTLKLKRRVIRKKFLQEIEKIYLDHTAMG
ncbi:MAG: long-chain fatty acid--CoA ligase [Bacteroidetes bacterium]|nr:long-chain fatty acid--CoA ligase [Bacteroidota bacterium]